MKVEGLGIELGRDDGIFKTCIGTSRRVRLDDLVSWMYP
jgi:hypothetical protein